jgi:hypothetical protein
VANPRFALDEDVAHPLAAHLRSRGWDVDSAKELGRLTLSDVQVLLRAAAAGQTLITHNGNDFEVLHEAWVTWRSRWSTEVEQATGRQVHLSQHAGILILPQLTVQALVPICEEFEHPPESIADRLFAWNRVRHWYEMRFLP